jgi:hypothetical protein
LQYCTHCTFNFGVKKITQKKKQKFTKSLRLGNSIPPPPPPGN